ncbi:MAG: hypothetical protein KAX84_09690 [Burkholderiales bacterium]|nr:hypothetical protein [Burkholderiales bacterium]
MLHTELSADTRAVADLLSACPVGETVSHGAMTEAIGRDILRHRYILQAARRVAQRETGAVFVSERGTGLRRLSAQRATETVGTAARHHIRRTARRARSTLLAATSGANDLPADAQRRLAAEVSTLGLMEHLARDAMTTPKEDAPMKPQPVALTARDMLARLQAGTPRAALVEG